MGLAQRLHRLGKTRWDSWGYWVEIKRKRWADLGAGSSSTVITVIPGAQFHTLMNIVKGTGVSGHPPTPSSSGFGGSHWLLCDPSACWFFPAFTEKQHLLSHFSPELIQHLLTANTANSQMSASRPAPGCDSPAVSLVPPAQIPPPFTLSC